LTETVNSKSLKDRGEKGMMRIRLTLLENDKIQDLGDLAIQDFLLPCVGDKLYYKGTQQYNVIKRHFNLMEMSLYDVEVYVEKTKESI
jgi:hypothetical protein